LKKPTGSVRFYKQKTKKTEPNRNRKKPSKNRAKPEKLSQTEKTKPKPEKTEPNQFEPVFALKGPNRTETGRFDPVSVWFQFFLKKKFRFGYFF
jgi:hypothetical protein